MHNVDCIIIYDNNSSNYSIDQIYDELKGLGIRIIIESVPFKKGPGAYNGSSWDSDFLQYAMFEHVRYMHCQNADAFVNSDIDELVYVRNNLSIFDLISEPGASLLFSGKWVHLSENNLRFGNSIVNHHSHNLLDNKSRCPNKWAVNLINLPNNVFFRVHEIHALKSLKVEVSEVVYLHHRCISTSWKFKRFPVASVDEDSFSHLSEDAKLRSIIIHEI
jgi:hypothetical protein